MRRTLLIFLSLVLTLVGWSTVGAEDGFYVIPAMKGKYAPVPKTGQRTPYDQNIPPKDDGALQKGVASPTPRFTDNSNGTVTDNLTSLIWMKNANAFVVKKNWAEAMSAAATVAHGFGGLTDGSKPGDWRLPNLRELQSLLDYGRLNPALPENLPFTEVQMYFYWTSTTYAADNTLAYDVGIGFDGKAEGFEKVSPDDFVWCVRGGP
jgi:hypothetical protein